MISLEELFQRTIDPEKLDREYLRRWAYAIAEATGKFEVRR